MNSDVELVSGAGIKENSLEVKIYPNPADEQLRVATTSNAKIDILDVAGSLLQSQRTSSKNNVIDISKLPAGVYFIKITAEKAVTTKKIIVQ